MTDATTAIVLDEAIRERWAWRRWYRARPDWGHMLDLARENDVALRALLRVRREAKRGDRRYWTLADVMHTAKYEAFR